MSNKTKLVVKPMIRDYTGKLKAQDFLPVEHAQSFEFSLYKGGFLKDVFNVDEMFEAVEKAASLIEKEEMVLASCTMPIDFLERVENKMENNI